MSRFVSRLWTRLTAAAGVNKQIPSTTGAMTSIAGGNLHPRRQRTERRRLWVGQRDRRAGVRWDRCGGRRERRDWRGYLDMGPRRVFNDGFAAAQAEEVLHGSRQRQEAGERGVGDGLDDRQPDQRRAEIGGEA